MHQESRHAHRRLVLSLPFRVREALQDAGRYDLLAEFFDRAERCGSESELVKLAKEYLASRRWPNG